MAWGEEIVDLRILTRLSVVSLWLSMGATYGCLPWSSVTFLIRSYNAPKAWYGVGRPFAIGAGVSLLLVVCRRQWFHGSRPLRARRARRSDRVRCGAGDDAPSTRSPERGGGSSRARGRSAGPRRWRRSDSCPAAFKWVPMYVRADERRECEHYV